MSRVLTREISGTQCLSISLSTINTNFDNLDTSLCTTSSTFTNLSLTPVAGVTGDDALGIPGIITAYAGRLIIPSNWTLCDGRELDKASFPELYSIIGDTYGAASIPTSFKVPNIQNITTRGTTNSIGVSGTYTTGVAPTARLTITSDTPGYFGTQTTYPSGYYRVQYVTGGYNLGSSSGWTNRVGYGCNLVHSNNTVDVYIGIYNSSIVQSYTTLISSGQNFNGPDSPWYYDFFHTGGSIYIHLIDVPYTDNTLGNGSGFNPSAPVYALYSAISAVSLNYIISTKT